LLLSLLFCLLHQLFLDLLQAYSIAKIARGVSHGPDILVRFLEGNPGSYTARRGRRVTAGKIARSRPRTQMLAPNLLAQSDPELWNAIRLEHQRQEDHVELIASENYVSRQVLIAQGSQLTNKYAEGYPGRRYYGGCEYVDMAETLAIERAKKLFGAPWANVQPHSGSQANQAVYTAVLKPGDTFLGLSLAMGGHLTHGSPVNLSGKLYRVVSYGLNEKEEIDYDAAEKIAIAEKPKLIVTGASAYALAIDWKRFRAIADKVGALLMADMAHYAGLIAVGLYPSPIGVAHFVTTTNHKTLRGPRGGMIFGFEQFEKTINSAIFPGLQGGPLMHVIAAKAVALAEALKPEFRLYQENVLSNARAMVRVLTERGVRIVSGRTDCHMFLMDLTKKGITGKDAEAALGRAHLTVNKNAIPNDPQKPAVTSGVRIGTPAMTTRGFRKAEAERLAGFIADVLDKPADEANLQRVAGEVKALCAKFPVYP
jgi:glycine hydroxymethyltransferase